MTAMLRRRAETNVTRRLYSLLLYLLVPAVLTRLMFRGLRNRGYWHRWKERFGFVTGLPEGTLWVHAVSVGEVRAAVPLVAALEQRCPGEVILVTTMTPTGSVQVRELFGARVAHCYLPYDLPSAVARFLERVQPRIALVMETELWPNLFHGCAVRSVPVVVANVRMSEKSTHRYLRFSSFTRATLAQVTLFAAQSEADAARLRTLGADPEHVRVTGSMKFEINPPASLREQAQALRRQWGAQRPVWIAASTREGEDELVLEQFRLLRDRFTDLLLILVPRHPERFAQVTRLCRRTGLAVALRSDRDAVLSSGVAILVGDTMGELPLFYAAADVAFVGGSLVPAGGHNLLEPAAAGVAVVFGPHMFNFAEIARLTAERAAGRRVRDSSEMGEAVAGYLANADLRFNAGESGRMMVEENRGALQRTLALLEPLITS
ncbi:MAG: lipid IV(A) 3-deoxy-D-manno-octulosonic acid transferase [Acidiferrobacterales bacterium]